MNNYGFAIERVARKIPSEMKRIFLIGALAIVGVTAVISQPILAHRKEEALRNWHDLPQSQRELRVPTSQQLDMIFPNGARQILEGSPQLILFSVDPGEDFFGETKQTFHKHEILGQTIIRNPTAKAALLASFYDGFVPPPDPRGLKQIGLGCFNPRHGLRATRDGKTVDLLICFGCMKFQGYLNDHQFATNKGISNSAPGKTFNRILTAAKVPLSPK